MSWRRLSRATSNRCSVLDELERGPVKYEEATKLWAGSRLRRAGVAFSEVTAVYFDSDTNVGCPTCGPETTYEARIYFTSNGKREIHRIDFYGVDEILKELFEVSEP